MEYKSIATLIKIEREKRDWDQSTLATMLQVGQQAISNWENGKAKPRKNSVLKMVDLFGLVPEEALPLAGFKPEEPDSSLVHFLPLGSLSDEKFELFCRDLIQYLEPDADVDRYGVSGDNQEGIDIVAKKKDAILAYQCKRHDQFGPEDVKAVVAAATFKAEHYYLLLSRPATKAAKDVLLREPTWSFWDRDKISAKVRELPIDDAIRLVDTYFQGHRKRFLGVENPSPWLLSKEFFSPHINKDQLFSHGWDFFGRKEELDSLSNFIKKQESALLIEGIGGVGKTRLIKAWIDNIEGEHKVRILANNIDIYTQDFDSLPKGKSIVVIDDAHERSDITALTSGILRFRPEAKLILSTRPYGIAKLRDELSKAGVSFEQDDMIKLSDLDIEAAKKLASQILKKSGFVIHADKIAEITKDCPLTTVVGSKLVALGKIQPELLNNAEEFRQQLLKSFRDIVAGEVGGNEKEVIKDLLDLVSLIQPVNPSDPSFQNVATQFLKRRADKTIRDIRSLEEAGVLLRRANKVRITPDLLGDFIRSEATYDASSQMPTRYADAVFGLLENELATNFLANISQLDWRLKVGGFQESLLSDIWDNLKSQFKKAKIFERMAILSALERVAYYQPKHVLDFVHMALQEPTEDVEEEHVELTFKNPDYKDVVHKLPPLLKYVAYHEEYLKEALNLLRKLAENDKRATNPYPEHPLRVLQDLASIEPGKPGAYNRIIAEHVIGWLKEENESDFSPFDVLDVLLKTEGHQTESKGNKITYKPFKVNAGAVSKLREEIINEAFNTIESGSLKSGLRALKTVSESLRYPTGILGQSFSDDEKKAWEPGIIKSLLRLKKIVKNPKLDPLIALEVRSAVSWHATHSKSGTKSAATDVVESIPTTLNYELTRALADGWGWTFERADRDFRSEDSALAKWRKKVSTELIDTYKDDFIGLINLIEERLNTISDSKYDRSIELGYFLNILLSESQELTIFLIEYLLKNPDSPLVPWFHVPIMTTAKLNHGQAISFCSEAMDTQNIQLKQGVASALSRGSSNTPILKEEIPLIKKLVKDKNTWIRRTIIWAFERFSPEENQMALDMLLSMDITDSTEVADKLLGEFDERNGNFKIEELFKNERLDNLLGKLVITPSIDDYHIGLFLSRLSVLKPEETLKLLKDRVEYMEVPPKKEDYRPFPHSWRKSDESPKFYKSPLYEGMLRNVRDWAAQETGSWVRFYYGSELLKLVSAGFDDTTRRVLGEWILSSDERQMKVASTFLSKGGKNFVWNNEKYVADIIEDAHKLGPEFYKNVTRALYLSVVQGSKSGTAGEPFPEDIKQRDVSKERMDKLPVSSPLYRFYKMLFEEALSEIKRHNELFESWED